MPSPSSVRRLGRRREIGLRARDDARHEHRTEHEADGVGGEGQCHAGHEQEGPDRWTDHLVGEEEGALHPGVSNAEILPVHETGHEGAARRVGERLRRAEDEQRPDDDGDADRPADDREDEDDQGDGPAEIDRDHQSAPVEPVRGRAAQDAEQEDRELPAQHGQGHEERIAGLRRHEQGPRRQHDPVAEVVHDRGRQQPPEAPPEPRWDDRFGRRGEDGSHGRQDSNRSPTIGVESSGGSFALLAVEWPARSRTDRRAWRAQAPRGVVAWRRPDQITHAGSPGRCPRSPATAPPLL